MFKWLSVNKLYFNAEKTEYMVFDSHDQIDKIGIEINNISIKIKGCKKIKYLGLILDNNLSFKKHIDYI